MADMAHTMNDTLEGDLKSIGSKAEAFGIALYDGINQPLRDIVTLGGEYISQLTNALKEGGFEGLAGAFGDVLADAVNVISGYIPKIVDVAVSVVKSFVGGIAKNSGSIAKTFSQVGTAVLGGISEIIPEIVSAGADIIFNLIDGFSEALPELSDVIFSGISELSTALTSGISKIGRAGTEIIPKIADGISQKIPEFSASVAEIITAFSETVNESLPVLITAGFQIVEALGTAILESLPVLAESAVGIIRTICENLPELVSVAVQIIDFICEELLSGENINALIESAVEILITLVNAIVENIDEILIAAEKIVMTICEELLKPENIEKLLEIGVRLLEELIVGLCEVGGKLLGFVGKLYLEVDTALRTADWGKIGVAIVEGICSGMLDCDFVLADYLEDFGENWLIGIQDIFDIHSPSKLMKNEVGKYLALGVGEGFAENADGIGRQISDSVSEWTSLLPEKSQKSADLFAENTVSVFGNLPSEIAEYLEKSLDIADRWGVGISDTGKNTAEKFVETLTSNIGKIPEISLKILNETSGRFRSWGTDFTNYGGRISSEFSTKILSGISGLPSQMNGVGKNLVYGLWNGISGNSGWLKNRIYDFGNEITANFRAVFGIHSPSAVMRDSVGKYLAQGIGVGFSEEIPDIADTALKAFENIEISAPEINFQKLKRLI